MESRLRASPDQFATLIEFMERHGDIAKTQLGLQGRLKADQLWQELAKLVNSIPGGVIKSADKWKKVWADWKTKTKKKYLTMVREESVTGGGPSRVNITASEKRLLGIMGIKELTSPQNILPPPPNDSVADGIVFNVNMLASNTEGNSAVFSGEDSCDAPAVSSPESLSTPLYPVVSTSWEAQRCQQRQVTQSPTPSISKRHRFQRTRIRRGQTPFERATSEFVAIENRRLQLEEEREKNLHQREMERLRLEAQRIEVDVHNRQISARMLVVLERLLEILPPLKSQPYEDE